MLREREQQAHGADQEGRGAGAQLQACNKVSEGSDAV